jgi:hypothetical protein
LKKIPIWRLADKAFSKVFQTVYQIYLHSYLKTKVTFTPIGKILDDVGITKGPAPFIWTLHLCLRSWCYTITASFLLYVYVIFRSVTLKIPITISRKHKTIHFTDTYVRKMQFAYILQKQFAWYIFQRNHQTNIQKIDFLSSIRFLLNLLNVGLFNS